MIFNRVQEMGKVLFVFLSMAVLVCTALAVLNPQLAPLAEESLAGQSLIDEDSLKETSIIKVMDSHGDFLEALEGVKYDLQASNTDVQTRGLFHDGVSYILVSNPYDVPKMVVVNPQIADWNLQTVQVKYCNLEIEKIWDLLQITVPASRSGLIIVHPSGLEEYSAGYNYPVEASAREELPSTGYNYPVEASAPEELPSTGYNYPVETMAREERSSTGYNCQGEGCSYLWQTSMIRINNYGQLTVDGLSGPDFDLQSSNMDVLSRGLFYNGIIYILVANPCDMPKDIIVNPQISNWNIQNVHVKYGTLMISKFGNLLHITVPGCQSALISITPQKKRYSFETGPKPVYSFQSGPKPAYSFQSGPKPAYSFRIGY